MERYVIRDMVLIIVLLALGLFFAGLAGYFWGNPNPRNNVPTFVSLAASAIGIVSALLIVLKFIIVTPIIEEIGRINRIILASSAASSTKSLEKFLDDFNRMNKTLN
jgi:hypothetical protein